MVVGSDEVFCAAAALGADLAMSVLDRLDGCVGERKRPVTNYVIHRDDPKTILRDQKVDMEDGDKPILHVILDNVEMFQEEDYWFSQSAIRNNIAFLGLHVACDGGGSDGDDDGGAQQDNTGMPMLAETPSQRCGRKLKEIFDSFLMHKNLDKQGNGPVVAISLDLALHLSLMYFNALPKSDAHGDSFHVMMEENSRVHVEYIYDYDKPGRGTDPLSCCTREVVVHPGTTERTTKASKHASAAAYSCLRGNNIDPVACSCIAASIATVLLWENTQPSVPLDQQITDFARKVKEIGIMEHRGMLVKKYMEFGYQ